MSAVFVIVLGAGAFVTTTVAATILIRRAVSASTVPADETWVQVDLAEKGMGERVSMDEEVYEAKHGTGWKEYSGDRITLDPGLLAPLVLHDELTVSPIRTQTGTPFSPDRFLPTPPRWQQSPALPDAPLYDPYIPKLERSPALATPALLEGGPEEGPTEHVDQALETNITSMPEDEVLPTGIISWPALTLAELIEEVDDALVSVDEVPVPLEDILPEPAEVESILQLELTPPTPTSLSPPSLSIETQELELDIKSPIIQDDERIVPVIDIKSPITPEFNSCSDSSLDDLLPPPPVYTRYDTIKSPIDPKLVETLLSPLSPQPTTVNIFVTEQEVVFAARVPLPMSIPPTPKPMFKRDIEIVDDGLVVDTKGSLGLAHFSDLVVSPKSPFVAALTLVLPPVAPADKIPGSPVSDADSDSDSELLSAPASPIVLKQPLSPVIEPISVKEPTTIPPSLENDIIIGEVMEVPTKLDQPEPAPDPAEPMFELLPFVPGSFDLPSAVTSSSSTQPVVNVSLLTGDVVQLCRAVLAMSNCAGLVAQFVVGFSMWWSLMLVPM